MATITTVLFDFIGTLTELVGYSLEASEDKLYRSLVASGYPVTPQAFFDAYGQAHAKYHAVRYGQMLEVTNAVWIADALNRLGYQVAPEDAAVQTAVNVFFEDYIRALQLRPDARQTLTQLSKTYRLGLVSNYTHAPVIYAGLRKLRIGRFFRVVVVSEEAGWRKPNLKIFEEALRRVGSTAGETLFVGDTPLEDIAGAQRAGMRTAFIPSQFKSLEDLQAVPEQPDYILATLGDLLRILAAP
jgi:HAD superfamily hydrolase (TIGR01549 family)